MEPERVAEGEYQKLFPIDEVSPVDEKWTFQETLVNSGVRPFKLRAIDSSGNLL